jgi:hypothetical protein
MAGNRRRPTAGLKDEDESVARRMIFLEYREENAKDMEREARGSW